MPQPASLTDLFPTGAIDTAKWIYNGTAGHITQTGDLLRLQPLTAVLSDISSKNSYQVFDGNYIEIQNITSYIVSSTLGILFSDGNERR